MIDRTHELPLKRQAQLVGISRGAVYYRPAPIGEIDLRLMRRIDELHLELPFAGSRMLRDLLRQEGEEVGRRHVGTLMRKMGIEALYRKPNTSKSIRNTRYSPTCCASDVLISRTRRGRWTSVCRSKRRKR